MAINIEVKALPTKEQEIQSPPQNFFPDLLRGAQNADGGWGYRPGRQSSAEPTAWAVLALQPHEDVSGRVLSTATDWLQRTQSAEGHWPTASGQDPACWATALACLALLQFPQAAQGPIARGLKWLCETWPAEGGLMWRLRQRWQPKSAEIVRQNHSLRGWGWTPQTASWVEPTAYSLVLLQNVPEGLRPSQAAERMELGEKMLYDRACPGGGWNAGNPLVYGVAGVPRFGPTAWALLALRRRQDRCVNQEGVAWLEQSYQSIQSPASLALAQICLQVYGRPVKPAGPALWNLYNHNGFLQNVPVIACASLAVDGVPCWLKCPRQSGGAE